MNIRIHSSAYWKQSPIKSISIYMLIVFSTCFLTSYLFAQSNTPNYYPLKVGFKWTYKMPGETDDNEQDVSVDDYSTEYNAYLVRTIWKLGNAFPVTNEDLIETRKNRVLNLGSRGGLLNSDWSFKSNLILQFPFKIKSHWQENEDDETEYTVIDFVTLTVQAGTFKNVCKIKKVVKTVNIQSYLYYAPNVGLIKEETIDKDKSVKMFRELTNYKLDEQTNENK